MSMRLSFPARLISLSPALALLVVLMVGNVVPAVALGVEPGRLAVLQRSINQEQGGWRIDYRLRYEGARAIEVSAPQVLARVDGWVSNSRVASHAVPHWSSVVVSGLSGVGDVITSADEAQRCRERATVRVWTGDGPPAEAGAGLGAKKGAAAASAEPPVLATLEPGAVVRVRLRLEHVHFLFGDYDPLLGNRVFELHLGPAVLHDSLPMDREQYLALPKFAWPAPPEDRRDTRHFMSAPDSLHIEAHIPGNQYYRFPERPVRYATRMRLRFWYLTAPGTEGDCRARIAQYKDTPSAWKVLNEGGQELCLKVVGRWTKVERVFQTEPEATTLALDFRISGADVGEMWIDDVSLEPLGSPQPGP